MQKKIKHEERKKRARKIVSYLKKAYPTQKSELLYRTHFQFAVAVILSAQCTDKAVNKVTRVLFKKYKTPQDFAEASPRVFEREISSIPFFRNKTKSILGAARMVVHEYNGKLPKSEQDLVRLPGVGYKTAHVILGDLFGIWKGIPTDTHVKRFARKFDLVDSIDLTKISKELEILIPQKDWRYVNNGLVLYGRYVCKAHAHDCSLHPLTKIWPTAGSRWPKT